MDRLQSSLLSGFVLLVRTDLALLSLGLTSKLFEFPIPIPFVLIQILDKGLDIWDLVGPFNPTSVPAATCSYYCRLLAAVMPPWLMLLLIRGHHEFRARRFQGFMLCAQFNS